MSRVAIATDSNSGILPEQAKELGVYIVPMPFTIDGKEFYEDISITKDQFFDKLAEDTQIFTSQPAVGSLMDLWDELLKDHDELVYIPMSSGLSSTCQTATMLAEQSYEGKVFVVNNQRISVTQSCSVVQAKLLADHGYTAQQITDILIQNKFQSSIYIMVDTLKYLKKGGRVTPAAAAIGTVFNIKPVLQIQGGKLDAFSKCRGIKQAKKIMLDAIDKDLHQRFAKEYEEKHYVLHIAHTRNFEEAEELKKELQEKYPGISIMTAELSLSVSCHIGPGALAIAMDALPKEVWELQNK